MPHINGKYVLDSAKKFGKTLEENLRDPDVQRSFKQAAKFAVGATPVKKGVLNQVAKKAARGTAIGAAGKAVAKAYNKFKR